MAGKRLDVHSFVATWLLVSIEDQVHTSGSKGELTPGTTSRPIFLKASTIFAYSPCTLGRHGVNHLLLRVLF